jgi:N-acylneuraminate cytidylyltransferase/CMP-N,N'-diacetyllegionaminic acid synthase
LFLVGGRPLLWWTVKSAHESKRLSRVIVSTDSLEIAEAARALAAEVPFMRPQRLAGDETPGIDVIVHALEWLSNTEGYEPDLVMVLQPTSPLRTADHIDGAIELLLAKNAPAVVSVTEVQYHPYWMKRVNGERVMSDFMTLDAPCVRRQDLPVLYAINGAMYLARRATLLAQRTFFPEGTRAFIMPQSSSLDIDTPWDAHLADLILRDAHEQRSSD